LGSDGSFLAGKENGGKRVRNLAQNKNKTAQRHASSSRKRVSESTVWFFFLLRRSRIDLFGGNHEYTYLEHLQQCLKLVPQIEIWGSTQEKLLQQCPIS
jgi:hypothetical protein